MAPKGLQAAARIDTAPKEPVIEAAYGESNRALFELIGKVIDDYPYPGAVRGVAAAASPIREAAVIYGVAGTPAGTRPSATNALKMVRATIS